LFVFAVILLSGFDALLGFCFSRNIKSSKLIPLPSR
jgi:hypothetical protein